MEHCTGSWRVLCEGGGYSTPPLLLCNPKMKPLGYRRCGNLLFQIRAVAYLPVFVNTVALKSNGGAVEAESKVFSRE